MGDSLHAGPYSLHAGPYSQHAGPYSLHAGPYSLHIGGDVLVKRRGDGGNVGLGELFSCTDGATDVGWDGVDGHLVRVGEAVPHASVAGSATVRIVLIVFSCEALQLLLHV